MESTKFKINKPKKNLKEDELIHLSKEVSKSVNAIVNISCHFLMF